MQQQQLHADTALLLLTRDRELVGRKLRGLPVSNNRYRLNFMRENRMSKYEAITVRLEPEDKAEIERAAKALQQSVSAFARDVIREDLNRRKLLAKAEGEQTIREVAA